MAQRQAAVQKVEDLDIGAIVVRTATSVVKNKPISVSLWVIGLLLAAFANGFSVDDATREAYQLTLDHAESVGSDELNKALRSVQRADEKYYNAKGWFWSCNDKCQKAYDQLNMAKAEAKRIQGKRDKIVNEARKEVGIWSTFGVKEVRDSFWRAWQSGKDFAARYTMMDAFFMMMPGGREESMVSFIAKIVMQYVINLTMGLIGAFFFFVYNVYSLVCSYGENVLSGLAFFLLVMVASIATVGTYLFAIYGTVAGGGIFLVKQAAKQAKLEAEQGRRPRQVQYGAGRPGGFRAHYE
mmetsp:Transcript_56877/g.123040  ORF Transcript_56877/g.123040 Transcript_56877/m.123040 type:complete len:297 (+) Transcript_56877:53-943(+)